MVYCDYKEQSNNTVTYLYGDHPANLTGEIIFYIDGSAFEIVKEPKGAAVHLRSINRLFNKYKLDFSKRIFKDKISYEC